MNKHKKTLTLTNDDNNISKDILLFFFPAKIKYINNHHLWFKIHKIKTQTETKKVSHSYNHYDHLKSYCLSNNFFIYLLHNETKKGTNITRVIEFCVFVCEKNQYYISFLLNWKWMNGWIQLNQNSDFVLLFCNWLIWKQTLSQYTPWERDSSKRMQQRKPQIEFWCVCIEVCNSSSQNFHQLIDCWLDSILNKQLKFSGRFLAVYCHQATKPTCTTVTTELYWYELYGYV
mgnify:CR=1 FL=1